MTFSGAPHTSYRAAEAYFERAYTRARWRRWWGRLSGNRCELKFLADVDADAYEDAVETTFKTLDIDRIVGTAGRPDRFDGRFRPLDRRDIGRWTGICAIWLRDSTIMPPIEVIETAEGIFVVDGNHRVSVARAIGIQFIEARVVVWKRRQIS